MKLQFFINSNFQTRRAKHFPSAIQKESPVSQNTKVRNFIIESPSSLNDNFTLLSEALISLKSDTMKIDCDCMPNCDDSNYFIQAQRSRVWFLGANFQFGIIDYPKMQLKRDLLFGFSDVLGRKFGFSGKFNLTHVLKNFSLCWRTSWSVFGMQFVRTS